MRTIRVNNKYDIDLYEFDTRETLFDRIASKLSTTTDYIINSDNFTDILNNNSIQVVNLFENITNISRSTKSVNELFKMMESIKTKLSFEDVIIPIFIYTSLNGLKGDILEGNTIYISSELSQREIHTSVRHLLEMGKTILSKYTENIEKNKQIVNKIDVYLKKFEIAAVMEHTDIEIEKIEVETSLNLKNITLSEIFNDIATNNELPFVTYAGFYKIFKEFIPEISWSSSYNDFLILKILDTKEFNKTTTLKDYNNVILLMDEDTSEIKVGLEISTKKGKTNQSDIVSRFLNGFSTLNPNVTTFINKKVSGVFYIKNFSVDIYVLMDLIMISPIFSRVLAIDESVRASRIREGIYIYFSHPVLGKININVSSKISDDPRYIKEFPLGMEYTTIKIYSAETMEIAEKFSLIISKLFTIYNEEKENIIQFYKKYIPTFSEKKIKTNSRKRGNVMLKDIAPEIFSEGYSKICTHKPQIIEDDEVQKAQKKGEQVMKYPMHGEGNFPVRNYVCRGPNKYPGLRFNPLSNNDQIPYLPCCYAVNQENKKGGYYRHYFYGEMLEKKEERKDAIRSLKFATLNQYAYPTEKIRKFFELTSTSKYLRKGVNRSKSSIIECLMRAFNMDNINYETNIEETEKIVKKLRKKIGNSKDSIYAGSQQTYDKTDKDITEMFNKTSQYLEPSFVIPILESFFDCNIYMFTISKQDSEMIIPRYSQIYYSKPRNKNVVVIIENEGGVSDDTEYPQCELLVKTNDNDSETVVFNSESKEAKTLRYFFNKLTESYILNTENLPFDIDSIVNLVNPELQFIDSYGKGRGLRCKYKEKYIDLILGPFEPLNISINYWNYKEKPSIKLVLSFLKHINATNIKQNVLNKNVVEITCNILSTTVVIPVTGNIVSNLDIIETFEINETTDYTNSYIDMYNRNKKNARYLIEYFIWLFSLYLHENNISESDILNIIHEFVSKNVKIDKNFIYSSIAKTFSRTDGFMSNGKLVLHSENILKKLLYTLKLTLIRDKKYVLNYYKKETIENYYTDISDFYVRNSEVILYGNDSIEKWILNNTQKNIISIDIIPKITSPYFFKNPLLGNKVYLAQNCDTLESALYISKIWYENGYNPVNTENIQLDENKPNMTFLS